MWGCGREGGRFRHGIAVSPFSVGAAEGNTYSAHFLVPRSLHKSRGKLKTSRAENGTEKGEKNARTTPPHQNTSTTEQTKTLLEIIVRARAILRDRT